METMGRDDLPAVYRKDARVIVAGCVWYPRGKITDAEVVIYSGCVTVETFVAVDAAKMIVEGAKLELLALNRPTEIVAGLEF